MTDLLTLAEICDDTRNVLHVQYINPNSKRWDYSDTHGVALKTIKRPTNMVKGGHHLIIMSRTQPHDQMKEKAKWLHPKYTWNPLPLCTIYYS